MVLEKLKHILIVGNYFSQMKLLAVSWNVRIYSLTSWKVIINEILWKSSIFEEMHSFFKVLYLAGLKKSQHLNTNELLIIDGTKPKFFVVIGKSLFHLKVQEIRFDHKAARQQRPKKNIISLLKNMSSTISLGNNSHRRNTICV